ncbi:MAG: transporter substrate-binding domain-containing protein [Coriobacteriia bacterium]|nr:transporter substrate-binding domain-containing protein [Coriobacteriia bacterium]MBS5477207.1 transporter substrate-binding domain-containing protein [Coriobacteriia bacterium]
MAQHDIRPAAGISRRSFIGLGGAVAGAGALSLVLAGCGADTDTAASDAGSDAPAQGEACAVKISSNNSTRPYCFINEDGELAGYDIDSLKLVEEKLDGKYAFSFEGMPFDTMIASLQSGSSDMASCALSRTEERLEKYLVPDQPYGLAPMVLAVRKDSGIESLADMAGKTLRCNATLAEYQAILKYNADHPDAQITVNSQDPIVSDADLFRAVENGQCDGILIFKGGFDDAQKGAGTDLVAVGPVMINALYYLMRVGDEELCADVSAALATAREDGSLGKVAQQWFGEDVFAAYPDFPIGADIMIDGGSSVYSVVEDGVLSAASSDADAKVGSASSSKDAKANSASSTKDASRD